MRIEFGEKIFREFHWPSRLVDAHNWERDIPDPGLARRVVFLENQEDPNGPSRRGVFEIRFGHAGGEPFEVDGAMLTATCDLGGCERWIIVQRGGLVVEPFAGPPNYTDYEHRLFDHALGFLLVNFAPEDVAGLGDPPAVHEALEALHRKVAGIGH